MEKFPLTTPQKNIWNLQKYYPDTAVSNLCGTLFYNEEINEEILRAAICDVVNSQSGLRLMLDETDEVTQYVNAEEITKHDIPFHEFGSQKMLDDYIDEKLCKPMMQKHRKMYLFEVIKLDGKTGVLLLMSHLICDAWTFGLLARLVNESYQIREGKSMGEITDGDYIKFVQSEVDYKLSERFLRDKAYWEEKYIEKPQSSKIKEILHMSKSINSKRFTKTLSDEFNKRMTDFCEDNNITEAEFFESALFIYLSKINLENSNITIGTLVMNRRNRKEKETAGMFVSTMPLTLQISYDASVLELFNNIKVGHAVLFRHQRYPYANILKNLREKQNFSGNLFDVVFSYQNVKLNINHTWTKWYPNGACEVPIAIHIENRDGDNFNLTVDYQTAVFPDEREVMHLVDRILFILEQVMNNPKQAIHDISIISQAEKCLLIEKFNDTYMPFPHKKCVHELFVEQVSRTPEQAALVFEDQEFTYRELDEMSNALAYLLQERGIGRGDIVPIISVRSWHIIVAMLGILKAGAAYMPISPDYPRERIEFILQQAKCKLVLLYGCHNEVHSFDVLEIVGMETHTLPTAPKNINESDDPCYVIYTSGSTGEPKGVMITHQNVINYCNRNRYNVCGQIIKDGYHSIISVTNFVFDIFVTETFLPLLNGMTIFLANDEECLTQGDVGRIIQENPIDVLQTTPTKMRSFLVDKTNTGYLRELKAIILGGEAFPPDLYDELRVYTDAEVYNIYGPTETTVWSTAVKMGSP